MQLKNRLKKMEKQLNVSEFCGCPDTPKLEFIERRGGETDTVITSSVADSCEQCRKPIEKQIIVINYVKSQKPDWMTDEQYAAAYA
jgi:ssDNA-binding Zn-finger/Zn-ribbon topoisomerase 1